MSLTYTWSTPREWTTGEVVTAANMNVYLSAMIGYLKGLGGAPDIEVSDAGTAAFVEVQRMHATSTGNMADGFGSKQVFSIEDTAAVDNPIGWLGFARNGADNTGLPKIGIYTAGSESSHNMGIENQYLQSNNAGSQGYTGTPTSTLSVAITTNGYWLLAASGTPYGDSADGYLTHDLYDVDLGANIGMSSVVDPAISPSSQNPLGSAVNIHVHQITTQPTTIQWNISRASGAGNSVLANRSLVAAFLKL